MIRDGKPIDYSGQGNFSGNIILAAVVVAMLWVGMYMLNLLSFETVWVPMLSIIGLGGLAYFIATQITGQSNTVDHDFVTDPAHETDSPNL